MADWPASGAPAPIMLSVASEFSIGTELAALAVATPASTAWPVANKALFVPFVVPEPIVVLKLWYVAGAAPSGNVDMGIYDEAFTRLVSIGSTAVGTASTLVELNITDTVIGRGRFYLAMSASATGVTTQRFTNAIATNPQMAFRGLGCFEQTTAHPVPATATPAVMVAAYIPLMGLAGRTLVA